MQLILTGKCPHHTANILHAIASGQKPSQVNLVIFVIDKCSHCVMVITFDAYRRPHRSVGTPFESFDDFRPE